MLPKSYKLIKIAGMATFIPFILVTGPLMGYVAGDYLQHKFKLPNFTVLILISLGFLSAVVESVRIIKLIIEIDREP